ncbi:MAG: hypothetical protein FJ298_07225 [Planctomycetes bacterium]|nr:hypothetical protein [Planctomycetota bacterium]
MTELKAILRGWGSYFRAGNASRQFRGNDRYVTRCLRRLLRRRRCHQGSGRNRRAPLWSRDWPHARFVADFGLHQLRGTMRYPGPSQAA